MWDMPFLKEVTRKKAMNTSQKYATAGQAYEEFTNMNNALRINFSRMAYVKASLYLFQIIDDNSINTKIFYKNNFIKKTYEDIERIANTNKNDPQMHFWAGTIKLCQFHNENHFSVVKKMESLMKARSHFQITLQGKPKHILAPYLLTACDNAYFDLSGTVPYPEISSRKPSEFHDACMEKHPEFLLSFSFVLGKLCYYIQQYYLAECFLNMSLCRQPLIPQEDLMSHDSLQLLNLISEVKKRQSYY